jgi:excisionase family DNA binding protein
MRFSGKARDSVARLSQTLVCERQYPLPDNLNISIASNDLNVVFYVAMRECVMLRLSTDPVLPSPQDTQLASNIRAAIAAGQNVPVGELPPIVRERILEILEATEAGNAVALVEVKAEVTTQQAADRLNVSRPFLVKLIEGETLPARLAGKHRRLWLNDVLTYTAKQYAEAEKALDEIVAFDQEYDLI